MHSRIRLAGRLGALLILLAISVIVYAAYIGRTAPIQHESVTSNASLKVRSADMSNAEDPQLRLLAQYEQGLRHQFTSEMLFVSMPRTDDEAQTEAATLVPTLKAYSTYNLAPLIIMEPTDTNGNPIDLTALRTFSGAFQSLLGDLKRAGITDGQIGTLVLLPEANLPDWGGASTDPALFAQNYTVLGGVVKRFFPNAHLSLLLDSTAYPSGDTAHLSGDKSLKALLRYITALRQYPKTPKIDSLGFQGFPWTASDNPSNYLNAIKAEVLARALGVHSIWFNTGTAQTYGTAAVSRSVREGQLLGELAQAKSAQASGFTVRMNIFGFIDTGVNWTYPLASNGQVAQPLPMFIQAASLDGVETSLFVATN